MKKYFFSVKKYSHYAAALFALLVIILQILTPALVKNSENNWQNELSARSNEIKTGVISGFNGLVQKCNTAGNELEELLKREKQDRDGFPRLLKKLNREEFSDFSIYVYDSLKSLVGWKKGNVSEDAALFRKTKHGEVIFDDSDLFTSFALWDSVKTTGLLYYYQLFLPLEKKYRYSNDYYSELSISKTLADEYNTEFRLVPYVNIAAVDGRFDTVAIKNIPGKKIGFMEFQKPLQDAFVIEASEFYESLRNFFLILSFLFAALKISEIKILKENRILRTLSLFLFLAILRIILLISEIPVKFLPGELTESANFSSGLGYGIVSSPFEFFVTAIFVLFICLSVFRNVNLYQKRNLKTNKLVNLAVTAAFGFFYLLLLRGLGAAVKSVIFDSSMFYFKFNDLLPKIPIAFMHFNLLILGICSIIASVTILLYLLKFLNSSEEKPARTNIFSLFIFFQAAGVLFDWVQKEPQGTPLLRIIYITLSFIIAWLIYRQKLTVITRYLSVTFFASFITVSLLIFYNSRLEIESLRTVAFELTRPDENWLEFIANQSADEAKTYIESHGFSVDQNFSSLAFICWSKSSLEEEGISSSVKIFRVNAKLMGEFNYEFDQPAADFSDLLYEEDTTILEEINPDQTLVTSVRPVYFGRSLEAYVVVSILFDKNEFLIARLPEFYTGRKTRNISPVDVDKLKILEITNGKVSKAFGGITLDARRIRQIERINLSVFNDTWTDLSVGNEEYVFYIMKQTKEPGQYLCVGQKLRDFSFGLFNFFKVFLVHTVYILITGLFLFLLLAAKKVRFQITFNLKLLLSFLIISIIPLLVMAFYFREMNESNNRTDIESKLENRAERLSSYLNRHWNNDNRDAIFDRAGEILGIDFTIFSDKEFVYSTKQDLYETGILPKFINPVAYNEIINWGYRKFLNDESIEKYNFEAFYYLADIGDRQFIIEINTAFNSVSLPMAIADTDVFMFGTYSLAVLIIILLSTLLARQISQPILKLTNATKAVAGGDLNYALKNNYKGEIKELIDGFNLMVKELKVSQNELAEVEREMAWKEMARQVAHEIKNPLTPMKLLIQQLIIAYKDESPKFDDIFEKVTSTTIRQIETLKNIASEFSNFARMPKLKLEKINLVASLKNTVNLFTDENAKIRIICESENMEIEADSDQLNRSIINLIRNALQAGASEIILTLDSVKSNFALRISDNGKGIKPGDQEKIFMPNFTTKTEGMGLGLSMVKRFIETIGGTISLEKSSNEGTEFLITFRRVANG